MNTTPDDGKPKTAAEAIKLAEHFERRAQDWDMDGPAWNNGLYTGPTEMGRMYREMAFELRNIAEQLP